MALAVCNLATLKCTNGSIPSKMMVLPLNQTLTSSQPWATIMDNKPMLNILPFGVCKMTLGPCMPSTPAPWLPGSPTILLKNKIALNDTSKLFCILGGVITVSDAGQTKTQIP
jgi:hypothetical protein